MFTYQCVYVCIYIYIHTCICTFVCVCVYIYIYIYLYIYLYMYIHTHTMCVYIYIYIYIYIYMQRRSCLPSSLVASLRRCPDCVAGSWWRPRAAVSSEPRIWISKSSIYSEISEQILNLKDCIMLLHVAGIFRKRRVSYVSFLSPVFVVNNLCSQTRLGDISR